MSLLVLDDSSPQALSVDTIRPPSSGRLHEALVEAWPRLAGRVVFEQRPLEAVALFEDDLVVSAHACGALADLVLDRASAVGARSRCFPAATTWRSMTRDHCQDGWTDRWRST
jgi:hypothetical protein